MGADDKQAIADLVHRYADAVCRRDEDQWVACWSEDAVWSLGGGREAEGRDNILELWRTLMSGFSHALQIVHSGAVDVDGDAAAGRWYIQESLRAVDGSTFLSVAWYDDGYVRTDGTWQFSRRALQGLYRGPADLSGEFVDLP